MLRSCEGKAGKYWHNFTPLLGRLALFSRCYFSSCWVQSSDIERQVQEKVDEFQNKREKDRKTLQEEVSKGISICAELDSTMRTMVEVIRAESQRISKCEMQIEALGDGDTIQFSFDAKQADFESLANQASSDITKIRASSKRRRSSLLKTLAVLGNDSN